MRSQLLEEQATSRVPELVPIRYGRMLASPFAFYRGGALIMAADLARTPRLGSPRPAVRRRAPVELRRVRLARAEPRLRHQRLRRDLARALGVGREAAGGELRGRRARKRLLREGAAHGRARYRSRAIERRWTPSRRCATSRCGTRIFRSSGRSREFTAGVDPKRLKRATAVIEKSRTKDSMQAFEKLTHVVDGEPRIISDPPLIVPIDELVPDGDGQRGAQGRAAQHHSRLPAHARDRPPPFDRRVPVHRSRPQGGRRRERRHPRLDRALPRRRRPGPALPADQGGTDVGAGAVRRQERVQQLRPTRRRRPAADAGDERHLPRLGPRQLRPRRQGTRLLRPPAQGLEGLVCVRSGPPTGAAAYGKACGWTLARAHARSGDRIAIAAYLGKSDAFDRALADFAETYADQNEKDYNALKEAVASGRVQAEIGLLDLIRTG